MNGTDKARRVARRAMGVPDASEMGATLGQLHSAVEELRAAVAALGVERDTQAAELAHLRDRLHHLEQVALEQAAALESMQSRLSPGPGR